MAATTLPDGYQDYGEMVVRQSAALCGMEDADDESKLSVEWKPGRLIVTVHGGVVFVSTDRQDDDDDDDINGDDDYDDGTDGDGEEAGDDVDVADEYSVDDGDSYDDDDDHGDGREEEYDDNGIEDLIGTYEEKEDEDEDDVATRRGVDVAQLARAINAALDDDGIGLAIAESHEIEVTTPGAKDELVNDVMFQAYRGFEVICQQEDTKTKEVKTVEGRLVERNNEFTILNIRGRMKKMKNGTVLSVRLPKAKMEKGKRR